MRRRKAEAERFAARPAEIPDDVEISRGSDCDLEGREREGDVPGRRGGFGHEIPALHEPEGERRARGRRARELDVKGVQRNRLTMGGQRELEERDPIARHDVRDFGIGDNGQRAGRRAHGEVSGVRLTIP